MLSMWALTSVLGPFLYANDPKNWKLMLWPYLYLFITYLIFIQFILRKNSHLFPINNFINQKSFFLDVINSIYIVCAIYELLNIDMAVLSISFLSEEAQELYLAAHEDAVIIKDPLFYCQRYTSALFILSAISVFNYLSQGRYFLGGLLFVFTLVSVVAGSAEIASRGVMMSQMIAVFSIYLLYRPFLSPKAKKTINIGGVMSGALVAAVIIAITIARFTDNYGVTGYDNPIESVISYFGHSMLFFNYGVCDVDFKTWGGARTFNYFATLLFGIDYRQLPDPGTHSGTNFITFVGMLVRDFDYIGTIILGVIVSFVMYKLWSGKNVMTFAGMYIYIFYLNRMIMGVFVTPPGSDYTYAWAIVSYIFLHFMLRPAKVKVKNNLIAINKTVTQKI